MFGGFLGVGSPERLFDALAARGVKQLTVIGNDTARQGVGVGKLIDAGCVARVIASHIGANPTTQLLSSCSIGLPRAGHARFQKNGFFLAASVAEKGAELVHMAIHGAAAAAFS